jgi:short subunit dehydrogenase-like uncharacterized protein
LKWAIAGRSRAKLDIIVQEILESSKLAQGSIDVIEADLNDRASLVRMTSSTRVMISTAGPFAKIGTPIVDACCRSGTNYVDITGEPQWVRTLIDGYHDIAKEKKIKIVPCCGFDCIPVDMGCKVMVDGMLQRGLSPREVRSVVTKMKGGASGGTIASVFNLFESCSLTELVPTLNPFYLSPRDAFNKLDQPASAQVRFAASDRFLPFYDAGAGRWCMPFVMQSIDTRVVNRSNALSGWRYGRDFIYSEGMAVPMIAALASALITPLFGALMLFSLTRNLLKRMLPQPGEGPSEEERETGYFHFKLWGRGVGADGKEVTVLGKIDAPDGDCGYKQTAVMVCEAAVCLAMDNSPQCYGILTPSTALGDALLLRLDASNIKISVDK